MKIPDQTRRSLEYDAWKELLAEFARSAPGKAVIRDLSPVDDLAEIRHRLDLTEEIRTVIEQERDLPIGEFQDVRERLDRTNIEGFILEVEDFFNLWDILRSGRQLRTQVKKLGGELPCLRGVVENIVPQKYLEDLFEQTFDPRGGVKDSASRELARIRKEQKRLNDRVERILQGMLNDNKLDKVFFDKYVTQRNGRHVLPVNTDQKGKIKGVVHHTSSSGATVFLEPLAVLEDNNAIQRLREEEKREVRRILSQLTQSVGSHREEVRATFNVLVTLDVFRAQARYAARFNLNVPRFSKAREIMLIGARHPLLLQMKGAENVVPTDVSIGSRYDVLVVTGPNTGGKTVALKTVGLVQLVAQTGCPIPTDDGSQLPVFKGLYADIGDDQDLEGSLSTFSAHMVKVRDVLKEADRSTLVLLDELGTGTDPAEGSALGIAMLRHLHARGALVMATTHQEPLKAFAYAEDYAENGSVEFDPQTLKPTYRLITGIPGESNAFHIAENLDLPREVIAEARRIRREGFGRTSNLIERLERDTREISEARAEYETKVTSAREMHQTATQKMEEAEAEIAKRLERAHREAESLLRDARHKSQFLVDRARRKTDEMLRKAEEWSTVYELRAKAEETLNELQGETDAAGEEAASHSSTAEAERSKVRPKKKKRPAKQLRKAVTVDDVVIGKRYRLATIGKEGVAASIDQKRNQVSMQVKGMVVKVSPDQLERVDPTEIVDEDRRDRILFEGAEGTTQDADLVEREAPNWLNVRGKTVEEALDLVDQYLDQAMLSRLPRVSILHGTGTGALKTAIRNYLRDLDIISEIRDGEQWEGGTGVTQVTFR